MKNRFKRWILRVTGVQQELDLIRRYLSLQGADRARLEKVQRDHSQKIRALMKAGAQLEQSLEYKLVEPHRPA